MRTKSVAIWAIALLLMPLVSRACEYPETPTFHQALNQATSAFVFRLDAASYREVKLGGGAYQSWVEGSIRPVQQLYGPPTTLRKIRYSPYWCGGVRLVVGRHYLVVTNATGQVLQVPLADRSIIELEGNFNPSQPSRNLRSPLILPVIQALYRVKPLPEQFPPEWIAERVMLGPPPPPPPQQR